MWKKLAFTILPFLGKILIFDGNIVKKMNNLIYNNLPQIAVMRTYKLTFQ